MEDRPRRDRGLMGTRRALPTPAAEPPARGTVAPRTAEPRRPAQPLQVVQTSGIVGEPHQQLGVGARIVLSRRRHAPSLPDLNRYPLARKAERGRSSTGSSRGAVLGCRCWRRAGETSHPRRPHLLVGCAEETVSTVGGCYVLGPAPDSIAGRLANSPALGVTLDRDPESRSP